MYALYKTGQWRRAQFRRRCSLSGAARPASKYAPALASLREHWNNISVDCEFAAPGESLSPAGRGRYLSKDI
jgi:hypothetical protein